MLSLFLFLMLIQQVEQSESMTHPPAKKGCENTETHFSLPPEFAFSRINFSPVMSLNTSFVSVLCNERGGDFCPLCVSLPPEWSCGWCHKQEACTTRDKCKVKKV